MAPPRARPWLGCQSRDDQRRCGCSGRLGRKSPDTESLGNGKGTGPFTGMQDRLPREDVENNFKTCIIIVIITYNNNHHHHHHHHHHHPHHTPSIWKASDVWVRHRVVAEIPSGRPAQYLPQDPGVPGPNDAMWRSTYHWHNARFFAAALPIPPGLSRIFGGRESHPSNVDNYQITRALDLGHHELFWVVDLVAHQDALQPLHGKVGSKKAQPQPIVPHNAGAQERLQGWQLGLQRWIEHAVRWFPLPSDMERNKSLDLISATLDFMISRLKKWKIGRGKLLDSSQTSLADILQSFRFWGISSFSDDHLGRPHLLWIKGEGPKELIISFFLPQFVVSN